MKTKMKQNSVDSKKEEKILEVENKNSNKDDLLELDGEITAL